MELSSWFVQPIVWLLSALVLAGALLVVAIRNLFRAALSLGLVLLGVAGLFILLQAEFLGFVQVLVYVGAILILVVFAVMLTAGSQGQTTSMPPPTQRVPAAIVSLALFAVLAWVVYRLPLPDGLGEPPALQELGQELVTTYVLPFEVVSLVFVAALVGAIVLAFSASPSFKKR